MSRIYSPILLFLVLHFLISCSSNELVGQDSLERSCREQKDTLGIRWTVTNIRTQGSGRVWFLGKAVSKDRLTSIQLSDVSALFYLTKECGFIPKEAKIIERCTEKQKDEYVSYSRVNVKDIICKNSSSINTPSISKALQHKRLTELMNRYSNESRAKVCTEETPRDCLYLASFEHKHGSGLKALKMAEVACKNAIIEGCRDAGFYMIYNKQVSDHFWDKSIDFEKRGRDLFKRACSEGLISSCVDYGNEWERMSTRDWARTEEERAGDLNIAFYNYKYSCDKGLKEGCVRYGFLLQRLYYAKEDGRNNLIDKVLESYIGKKTKKDIERKVKSYFNKGKIE